MIIKYRLKMGLIMSIPHNVKLILIFMSLLNSLSLSPYEIWKIITNSLKYIIYLLNVSRECISEYIQ